MTHRSELKKQTRTAVDLVAKWHKSVAGTIIADEYISDLSPFKGAELCIAAEVMFSLAYIYQFLADNDIADWVEQAAYNAFPALRDRCQFTARQRRSRTANILACG